MANPDIPRLLREAERRVNEHVWGDRRAIVSIPADVSRDVDILLLTAADEIERLRLCLVGVSSCSTCPACRGAAEMTLNGGSGQ